VNATTQLRGAMRAYEADPRPCDPDDAVRIVDRTGASVQGCLVHGAVLLASIGGGRVYPLHGPDGSAITVYTRALSMAPFDFLTPAPRHDEPSPNAPQRTNEGGGAVHCGSSGAGNAGSSGWITSTVTAAMGDAK